jgi:hypothetical protein
MKLQQLAIALTVVNLVLLLFTMTQVRLTTAQTVTPILRGRTLELVDERGVVRARLGVKEPSTVVELDLFDKNGINHVKLGAGDSGSGLLLTDETTDSASYVQIIARRTGTPQFPKTTSITLKGKDGRERVITP